MKQNARIKLLSQSVIQLEDFKRFSGKFFKLISFDLSILSSAKDSKQYWKIVLSDFFFWFTTTNTYLLVIISAVSALKESVTLAALTFALPLLSSNSMVVFKCATVYFNKSHINDIFDRIRSAFPEKKSIQQKYNIRQYYKRYIVFSRFYAIFYITPCVCVLSVPVITFISSGKATLPLNISLPFDYESNLVYVIVYSWIIWALFLSLPLILWCLC